MENQNQNNQLPSTSIKTNTENYLKVNQIINAQSFKKIREIANPEEPIGKTILRICHMIGLVEDALPSVQQICDWVEGIRKYYPQYAPEELFLACELNHYGKLSAKIEHYGKFSIDYLSACLKLYDDKKREAIHAEKTKIEPPKPIENQHKALGFHAGRAYYIELEKWVKTTGSLPLFWDWSKAYQFLLDDGQLTDFPKSRMLEIFDRFKSKGMSEATVGRFAFQDEKQLGKMIGFDELSKDDNVKHECRKYVVQQYLTKKFEIV